MSGSERKVTRAQGSASGGSAGWVTTSAPMQRKIVARPDGTSATQLSIDITDLAPPDRRYSVDAASVQYNGSDAIHFAFVQHTLAGTPRSMVAVKMYADSVRSFMENCVQFLPSLEEAVARNRMAVPVVEHPKAEPSQSVTLVATLAQMTFGGFEAEMSFFHLSPYTVHVATKKGYRDVPVEPIVQVDMATGTLLAILRQVRDIVPKLPAEQK